MRAALLVTATVERLFPGDDVNGRCIVAVAGSVRQPIVLSSDRGAGALKPEPIAEPLQQRNNPPLARQGDGARLRVLAAAPEGVPKHADVGEGRLDLGAKAAGLDAEILRLLTLDAVVAERDTLDDVGGEETALDRDADPAHVSPPAGSSTKQPRMSGGSCGWTLRRGELVSLRNRACARSSSTTRLAMIGACQSGAPVRKSSAQPICSAFSEGGTLPVGRAAAAISRPAVSSGSSQ